MNHESSPHQRHLYGRRLSRPLKTQKRQALMITLPDLQLVLPNDGSLDITDLQKKFDKIFLEVGFGTGDHLVAQAIANPQDLFIGCEPFISGVASVLMKIQEHNLHNIRIVVDDARVLLKMLPPNCLNGIYVLFPDPWPKKRHNKRRIIQPEFINCALEKSHENAFITIATDHEDYREHILEVLNNTPVLKMFLEDREDIFQRPKNWIKTRYEQKGLDKKHKPAYMTWIRK